MAEKEKPLLIKRYASRRLYNTETSDYVTLEDIAAFIRDGREVTMPVSAINVGDLPRFKPGDKINVVSVSKGKGFQGVVKRWGFHGGPATHGSKSSREVGSIGQCATPAKVWKNRKMPGQTGNRKKTVKNLEVVQIDLEKNLIAVKGAVPGHANGYVMVTGKA